MKRLANESQLTRMVEWHKFASDFVGHNRHTDVLYRSSKTPNHSNSLQNYPEWVEHIYL